LNNLAQTSTNWSAVLAAVLCGIAVAMNIGKVPLAMPYLREDFHLSLVAAGWVSSMINTMAAATALLFGLIGGRVGVLRMCLFGLGASVVGCAGALFATDGLGLMLSRFVEGVGMVSVVVSAPALLSSASASHDRRLALSIWSTYMPAGIGGVMLLAPFIMALDGWRAVWWVTLVALVMAMLTVYRNRAAYYLPGSPTKAAEISGTTRSILRQPAPWLLGAAMSLWAAQHFALIIWLPTFLREQRGMSTLGVSLLTCLMVLVNVPGNLLGGRLLQRGFQRGTLIAVANVITGLSSLGIFLDLFPDLMRYVLCLALSFVGGLIPASVLSSSASLAHTQKQVAALQGLFIQCSNLGAFLAPPLIAILVAASGQWRDAAIVPGVAGLCSIVLGLILRTRFPFL
jgi:CP family cyanate transporter-like MFS transporter